MSDEDRDGPFDLKPSEIVSIMGRVGVHISREQAAAFGMWCYSTFRQWKIENTPMPEFDQFSSKATK